MKSKQTIIATAMAMSMAMTLGIHASAMTIAKPVATDAYAQNVVRPPVITGPITKVEKPVVKQGKLQVQPPTKYWAYETVYDSNGKPTGVKLVQRYTEPKVYLIANDGKYELQFQLPDIYKTLGLKPQTSPDQLYSYIQKFLLGKTFQVKGTMTDYIYDARKDPTGKYKPIYERLKAELEKHKVIKVTEIKPITIYPTTKPTLVK